MERSVWEPVLLVGTAVIALGLPWRVHVSTARWPERWLALPDLLVSLTILAATVWAVVTVVDGQSPTHVLPATVTAALAAGADLVRSRSGLAPETPVMPMWFVPSVLLTSAAGTLTWGVADGAATGTRVGVAVLVMASPAAAILAVPVAFAAGTSRARSAGVRLGGIEALDAATRVDTLVLDKHGTVTTGDLTVVSVDPVEPDHDRNLRWFAGALEKASDHRVGQAIATLSARGRLSDVEVVEGQGIQGSVDRHPVRVGSPQWIGIQPPPTIWTTVGVEVDGRTLGSITVADDVRPDLARDIDRLRALGLELVLVADDAADRTQHVAELAGIASFHSSCGPAETADVVRDLRDAGHTVATAGLPDGSDAALALSTSDSSDPRTIMVDDLSPARIAAALEIARAAAARVRRAGRVAAGLGAIGALIAVTGLVTPVVLAAAAAGLCGATAVACAAS